MTFIAHFVQYDCVYINKLLFGGEIIRRTLFLGGRGEIKRKNTIGYFGESFGSNCWIKLNLSNCISFVDEICLCQRQRFELNYKVEPVVKNLNICQISIFVIILVDFDKYWIWDEQACLKIPNIYICNALNHVDLKKFQNIQMCHIAIAAHSYLLPNAKCDWRWRKNIQMQHSHTNWGFLMHTITYFLFS